MRIEDIQTVNEIVGRQEKVIKALVEIANTAKALQQHVCKIET
jgi:hypothetical protein